MNENAKTRHLQHVLAARPRDASDGCPIDLALDAVQSIDCNDVMAHDATTTAAARMDRHLNIRLVSPNDRKSD